MKYEESEIFRIRHSSAHVMAQAVLRMFPDGKVSIGPPIANGFYYDFDLPRALTPEDLEAIEGSMKELLQHSHRFHLRVVEPQEARELFADQPYKLELIEDILQRGVDEYGNPLPEGQEPELTTYKHDDFEDLCRGPHVEETGKIDPDTIKILNVAGAYWRGDETRPMLQRIYATAWQTPEELEQYLHKLEEAKKRDHRTLGKQLDLYSVSDSVGPGLILWHPKGAKVRFLAERFSQEAHLLNGYEWVYTPHIGRENLWQTSGHLEYYRDSMFKAIETDGEDFYLKPMNCPMHSQIYKSQLRSYRDLPLRYAEFGTVYRYERSGVLHGLTRVRGFTQDDAHTFCLPSQIDDEILLALRFSLYVLRSFGLGDFKAYIATRPEGKAIGSVEEWDKAIETLSRAVEKEGLPFEIDEGGGAFYGPKIDLKLTDALDRGWQLSTIQFDFNLPERFDLEYIGEDGQAHRPYMVHRALFGSAERFFGMLLEHYGGSFPLWLAPVQVMMIPITDKHVDYSLEVAELLKTDGSMRIEINDRNERMQAKVREFEMQKVPYALIVGKKEIAEQTVSVRCRDKGNLGSMSVAAFLELTQEERDKGAAERLPQ